MVYVDGNDLKWMPYVKTWLEAHADRLGEVANYILELFETIVEDGLQYIAKKCTQAIHQVGHKCCAHSWICTKMY